MHYLWPPGMKTLYHLSSPTVDAVLCVAPPWLLAPERALGADVPDLGGGRELWLRASCCGRDPNMLVWLFR